MWFLKWSLLSEENCSNSTFRFQFQAKTKNLPCTELLAGGNRFFLFVRAAKLHGHSINQNAKARGGNSGKRKRKGRKKNRYTRKMMMKRREENSEKKGKSWQAMARTRFSPSNYLTLFFNHTFHFTACLPLVFLLLMKKASDDDAHQKKK